MTKALMTLGAAAAIGLLFLVLTPKAVPPPPPVRPESKPTVSRPALPRDPAPASVPENHPKQGETATFDQLWEQAMTIPDDRRLILAEVERQGGKIKESFIDADMAAIVHGQFHDDQQAFERKLAEQGLTLESFRARRREDIIITAMKAKVTRDITDPEAKKQAFNQWITELRQKADPGAKAGGAGVD